MLRNCQQVHFPSYHSDTFDSSIISFLVCNQSLIDCLHLISFHLVIHFPVFANSPHHCLLFARNSPMVLPFPLKLHVFDPLIISFHLVIHFPLNLSSSIISTELAIEFSNHPEIDCVRVPPSSFPFPMNSSIHHTIASFPLRGPFCARHARPDFPPSLPLSNTRTDTLSDPSVVSESHSDVIEKFHRLCKV